MRKALQAVPLYLACLLPVYAQASGIAGQVTAPDSVGVGAVVISVTQLATGAKREVLTSAEGRYALTPLLPGEYQVEALRPGFKPVKRTGVALAPGVNLSVDLQMEVELVSEIVFVPDTDVSYLSPVLNYRSLLYGSLCDPILPEFDGLRSVPH